MEPGVMSSTAEYNKIRINRRRRKRASSGPSLQLHALYGKPLLLPGESEIAYLDLSDMILGSMAPRDAVQQFLVRDIIDLTWDIHRLQAAKISYIRGSCREAALELIHQYEPRTANTLRGENLQASNLNKHLKRLKITPMDVNARAVMNKLDIIDKVNRQMGQIETRRNALLLEFEQRREAVDRWTRRELADKLEGAKITPPEIEGEAKIIIGALPACAKVAK